MNEKLRLAVQNSGRLSDASIDLLSACGITINRPSRKLRAVARQFDLEVLYLRDDDIPGYVADGVADAGIVGENVILETGSAVESILKLGFGRCRLSVALPRDMEYSRPSDLEGKHLATSYPVLLGRYLDDQGVRATIHQISGSAEIAPGIGLADGICDLVSSGSTLISNGLKEVAVILESEAVLVAGPDLPLAKRAILNALRFRIESVLRARRHRYILMNVPNDAVARVTEILPGMKSPTVMPLAEEGWSSVHSVIPEDEFWNVIDRLGEAGAQGMLIVPIEKMVL